MTSTLPTSTPTVSSGESPGVRWWRRPWVIPLALVAFVFIGFSLPRYLTFDPAQSLVEAPDGMTSHYPMLVAHVFFGSIAMLTCCLQVWPWLRQRHPRVHRISGRVYILGGVLPSGLMGLTIGAVSVFGPVIQVSNVMLALLWLGTTVAGYVAARQRRFRDHRRWMVRSFALTMSIVINRILLVPLIIWLFPQQETTFGGSEFALMQAVSGLTGWMSWTIALILAQLWLDRRPRRVARVSVG